MKTLSVLILLLFVVATSPLKGDEIPCELSQVLQKNKIKLVDLSIKTSKDSPDNQLTFFFITTKELGSASFTLYDKSGAPFRRIILRNTDIVNNRFATPWKALRKYKSAKFKDEIFDIKGRNFLYIKKIDFIEKSLIKKVTIEPYTFKI